MVGNEDYVLNEIERTEKVAMQVVSIVGMTKKQTNAMHVNVTKMAFSISG
jgi:hypothetical protein